MTRLTELLEQLGIDLRVVETEPTSDELRIVEGSDPIDLGSLDEDGSIMDVPLNLSEGCTFSFDKHVEAIAAQQREADEDHRARYRTVDWAIENRTEWNKRYAETPANRTRLRKG